VCFLRSLLPSAFQSFLAPPSSGLRRPLWLVQDSVARQIQRGEGGQKWQRQVAADLCLCRLPFGTSRLVAGTLTVFD
jgi:hypothetical protein